MQAQGTVDRVRGVPSVRQRIAVVAILVRIPLLQVLRVMATAPNRVAFRGAQVRRCRHRHEPQQQPHRQRAGKMAVAAQALHGQLGL